jgi:phosphatidylglycerophosphate synthase
VTPNHLTTARLATGLAAAAALAVGEGPWPHVGGGLFVVSMLLDRADGDLARFTGRTSPGGHRYDLIADTTCNALTFVGLGIGLVGGRYGPWAAAMGLLAGLAVAAVLLMVMRAEAASGSRAAELKPAAGFDADDAMLAVPLAVWLDWSEGLLLAAAVGAPAFALLFGWLFRRTLWGQTGA